MKIWIDADAAPGDVKQIILRASRRLRVETLFVANRRLQLPADSTFAVSIVVSGGPDEADRYIAEHASRGDLAVTADIPLASILVEKGILVIDPRGEEYSAENIGERLAVRDWMDGLRGSGVQTPGARPYGAREKQTFANTLDRLLSRAKRQNP